jgi:hypothetical protein
MYEVTFKETVEWYTIREYMDGVEQAGKQQ